MKVVNYIYFFVSSLYLSPDSTVSVTSFNAFPALQIQKTKNQCKGAFIVGTDLSNEQSHSSEGIFIEARF